MAPAEAFEVRLAESERDLLGAQRLRYRVFVEELGGGGAEVDHGARLERDARDPLYDHMIVVDPARDAGGHDHVVGVYRLLPGARAASAGGFYSAGEYDLDVLERSGRRLLELGRSCLHPDYRGGPAMMHLWQGLARYVAAHEIEILFGVASFHGTDVSAHAEALSLLHHRHLAPPELRVRARAPAFERMDLLAAEDLDAGAVMRRMPALIKAYLRLGGVVGEGAFVDTAFNTTDICLIVDTARVGPRQRAIYGRAAP